MQNFRTYDLAKRFYQNCKRLKFKAHLRDQFNRALLSIVLNIAEGSGKRTKKDRQRFYSIAMGSLREVQAILELEGQKYYFDQSDRLGACLYKLIQNPGGR